MKARITKDNKFIYVYDLTKQEEKQLQYSFKKRIKSWRFNPLVKSGVWDGYISYIDKFNKIPIGLWNELKNVSTQFDYNLEIEGLEKIYDYSFVPEDFKKWCDNFFKDSVKKPRDYQIDSAISIIQYRRSISEIATSAGKTLIIFMIFAYLKQKGISNRMLMVVPNTNLILQTLDDFEEYNNGQLNYTVQKIYGTTSKEKEDVDFVIGTFQSLVKLDTEWFDGIDTVAIDESHFAHSKSIKTIITNISDVNYIFGMSGTLKAQKDTADSFTMQAYIGPKITEISSKFLIDNKYASDVKVKIIRMRYLAEDLINKLYTLRSNRTQDDGAKHLNYEKKIAIENRKRFNFMANMFKKTSKNSLILFADVKYGYGRQIYDWLRENTQKKVFYVDGNVDVKSRTRYFDEMEKNTVIDKIEISFGDKTIKMFPYDLIPLSNGKKKEASCITKKDDILDEWIFEILEKK